MEYELGDLLPYELPEGWKWTRLGDFIDTYRGVSYKKTDAHSERLENDCLIMRGGNIDEGKINTEADNVYVDKSLVSQNQFVQKNDVIIVTSTGSTKVIGRAGISYQNYSDVAFGAFLTLARPNGKAEKAFVNQYFQSPLYRERIRQLASGVNINNIRLEYITESPFPLPPTLAEQQRIVSCIESLFTKLDEAKDKAQSVVDGFELRRAAVLHKAFTGELTAKWRKENGVSDDSWEEKTIGECCTVVRGGSPRPAGDPKYYDGTIPFMKVADITGNDSKYVCSTQFTIKEAGLHKTRMVEPDTLLLTNSGATLGVPAITKIKTTFNDGIAAFLNLPKESNLYFYYFFTSKTTELRAINMGAAQPNLNIDIIKSITIPVPTLAEQQEIVRILDSVLEKEADAKETAEYVLSQIDLLKKSILARAFRGEL